MPTPLFQSQLVKDREVLHKKAPLKTLRVLGPIKTSPFMVATTIRKEAPSSNQLFSSGRGKSSNRGYRGLTSTEKMVPEGCLHMWPFQFHLKEHWTYSQSLDSFLLWSETISAHQQWWKNPANVTKGADLYLKDHSIQIFTDASNEGWGAHLEQASTKGLWSESEKRLHIKF